MEFDNKELFGKVDLSLHIKQACYLFYFILSILCFKLILYNLIIRYTKIHKSTGIKIDHIYSSYLSIRAVK